jgi:hypothetical protein
VYVCVNQKSKMVATTGQSFDMGCFGIMNWFFSGTISSWLKPNCIRIIVGWSFYKVFIFCVNQKSKTVSTTGYCLAYDPVKAFFQKLQIFMNQNSAGEWYRLRWASSSTTLFIWKAPFECDFIQSGFNFF